jgi:hypothetical protein
MADAARLGSLLEELVRRPAGSLLFGDVGPQALDLVLQELDAFRKLADREQCEILADLVRDLLFWAVVLVDCWHDKALSSRML